MLIELERKCAELKTELTPLGCAIQALPEELVEAGACFQTVAFCDQESNDLPTVARRRQTSARATSIP
jgi:hypothetical protein